MAQWRKNRAQAPGSAAGLQLFRSSVLLQGHYTKRRWADGSGYEQPLLDGPCLSVLVCAAAAAVPPPPLLLLLLVTSSSALMRLPLASATGSRSHASPTVGQYDLKIL